jgi:5'(3')-deoxyribonucleotidase
MTKKKIAIMMDYVTSVVIAAIIEDEGIPADKAMKAFYNSQVFDRLCDVDTGLYRESGGYVHDLYKIEIEHGRLVQLEI